MPPFVLPAAVRRAAILAVVAFSLPFAVSAIATDAAEQMDKLAAELEQVRSDLTKAQEDLSGRNKAIWDRQHELEYNDPVISKLREEIKALEAQMVQKRQELSMRISLVPAMKDLEKDRQALFKNLKELREREQAILRELSSLEKQTQYQP